MVFVGFIQGFLQKRQTDKDFKEEAERLNRTKKKGDTQVQKSANFEKFVTSAAVKRRINEWTKKWKYKKRGVMALMYILWLNEDSDEKVLKTAKEILSKLKGEDIFAKFLNVLKLAPEERMK